MRNGASHFSFVSQRILEVFVREFALSRFPLILLKLALMFVCTFLSFVIPLSVCCAFIYEGEWFLFIIYIISVFY